MKRLRFKPGCGVSSRVGAYRHGLPPQLPLAANSLELADFFPAGRDVLGGVSGVEDAVAARDDVLVIDARVLGDDHGQIDLAEQVVGEVGALVGPAVEFELLDVPDVAYHLWLAYTGAEVLAGDYALRFCDLEVNVLGTWTPVDATTVRWTPVVPALLFPGYWVVVAEERSVGFEGLYGVQTGGTPRPRDADGFGRDGNHGCGP